MQVAAGRFGWLRHPLVMAMASGILLWAAFPPLGAWPLAWVAPLFWLLLIRQAELPGWRPYLAIWLAGMLHWAAVMQGVRLAHPALYLGWLSLAAYLAVYPVLFVGLTRVAVHRLNLSILFAAPVVWTGLELFRGHALTGFSMALLGHTQVGWAGLIQIADLGGAYAVSFVVMFVAAALARSLRTVAPESTGSARRWNGWPLLAAAALLVSVLVYGHWRLGEGGVRGDAGSAKTLRAAVIQGAFDTVFEADPQRDAAMFSRYLELSRQAVQQDPDVELIVWPESAFTGTLGDVVADEPLDPPADIPLSPDEFRRAVGAWDDAFQRKTRSVAAQLNQRAEPAQNGSPAVSLIAGSDSQRLSGGRVERFNSALLIPPDGQVAARYHKMHLVMFGEYIPFGRRFPLLYRLTPMTAGLTPGVRAQAFQVGQVTLAPSICFESTVPHLIRRQVVGLRRAGTPPEVLVNVTNDGWFWGSSILDLHLACAVFRAVENRLPVLVAANPGISACIDANGRIDQQGPRREEAILYSTVRLVARRSWYQLWGDMPAILCLLFCGAVSIVGVRDRLIMRKKVKT